VTRFTDIDDATLLALERHETLAHAIPHREVRDLGDALVLYDPRDADPYWNRLVSVRWPEDPLAFDRRLNEALALFALLARAPHIWPSPVHARPADLVDRLRAHGFRQGGAGHVMVLADPGTARSADARELGPGVTLATIRARGDEDENALDDIGLVLAESFGAPDGHGVKLAADLRVTLDDPRVLLVLARVDGQPAAVAKATTFDGLTYLSSIGTRSQFRGRGLARLVTRHATAVAGTGSAWAYLGVWAGNESALRVYDSLGFASIGVAPDLLLA
jgi:ribosomal protein S18 acetylase RimI-like enzyme